jgi:non-specific serine/threonine protein kinase/serine/threonine-protein kinase
MAPGDREAGPPSPQSRERPGDGASRWNRVRDLFEEALDLEAASRDSLLDAIAERDPPLAAEVRSLLAAHEEATGVLDTPPLSRAAAPPDRIGPYRILELIGRGGMGVVYRATRDEESFTQQVAIKLIDPFMRSDEILRRFRAERQILAMLEHPNIARLIDGGTAPDGSPYLVMEYVAGKPLLAWCDEHQLNVEGRLALFLDVCNAVQFAHQHLVVHRDLKSDNILVTEDGLPRLLDFGIAKLLSPEGGPALTVTAPMNRMLTPDYASPEQIRGEPATVAGDVYSLGVVLYELLSGSRPFHFITRTPEEILRVITQVDPVPPSQVVTRSPAGEAARRRGDTTSRLRRRLSGDLDYVVLKALERDPSRRYASVDQLVQDLRRHLDGFPVLARGRSATYRVSRFVSRHRTAVVTTGLVMLSLIAGLAATSWQARVARHERDLANRRFQDVRELANAVVFDIHDAIASLPGSTRAREKLVHHALRYLDGLSREAKGDLALQRELALAYTRIGDVQGRPMFPNLGQTPAALASYDHAFALLRDASRAQPDSASIAHDLIVVSQRRADLVGITLNQTHQGIEQTETNRRRILSELSWHPDDFVFEGDLCVAYGRLIIMKNAAADTLGAIADCRAYLALAEKMVRERPDDPGARRGALVACTRMAEFTDMRGDRDSAAVFYRRAEGLAHDAVIALPNNTDAARDLAIVYGTYGIFLAHGGAIDAGVAVSDSGMRIFADLAARDPGNVLFQSDLAEGHHDIGTILVTGRRSAAAERRFADSYELFTRIAAADTANTESRIFMARSSRRAGEASLALARQARSGADRSRWRSRALSWLEKSREIYRELAKQGRLNGEETTAPGEVDRLIAALPRRSSP